MTDREREDRLNDALDSRKSGDDAPATGDQELDALVRMSSKLRDMPRPEFKDQLRAEVAPKPAGWRGFAAGWFPRNTTPRVKLAAAGAAFAASAAAVLLGVFLMSVFGSNDQRQVRVPIDTTFEMTASDSDAIGVDLDTTFVLASAHDLDVDTLRAILHVEPQADFDIERESAGRYVIRTAEPLQPGTVYNFRLEEEDPIPRVLASFAFQTKTPVLIVQSLPRNEATGVPLNTGIELTFTQERVQDIGSHFQI